MGKGGDLYEKSSANGALKVESKKPRSNEGVSVLRSTPDCRAACSACMKWPREAGRGGLQRGRGSRCAVLLFKLRGYREKQNVLGGERSHRAEELTPRKAIKQQSSPLIVSATQKVPPKEKNPRGGKKPDKKTKSHRTL